MLEVSDAAIYKKRKEDCDILKKKKMLKTHGWISSGPQHQARADTAPGGKAFLVSPAAVSLRPEEQAHTAPEVPASSEVPPGHHLQELRLLCRCHLLWRKCSGRQASPPPSPAASAFPQLLPEPHLPPEPSPRDGACRPGPGPRMGALWALPGGRGLAVWASSQRPTLRSSRRLMAAWQYAAPCPLWSPLSTIQGCLLWGLS